MTAGEDVGRLVKEFVEFVGAHGTGIKVNVLENHAIERLEADAA